MLSRFGTFTYDCSVQTGSSYEPGSAGAGERWPVPPLSAVMCAGKPEAEPQAPTAPRVQNPAAPKMLALVAGLEEELFAAEARRHDAEVHRHQTLQPVTFVAEMSFSA